MTNNVATPINAACWAEELHQIAERADALERDPEASLADRLDLATAAFSRLWLAWGPRTVARSCRASSRLLEPVLVAGADLDQQLQENQAVRMEALKHVQQLEQPAKIEPVMPDDDKPDPVARRCSRRTMERDRPEGWLSTNEVAAASGCSSARVRYLMRSGKLPAAMVLRVSLRGLWFNPEVVQVVEQMNKKIPRLPSRRI
jgi:hypothetical protein